MFSQVLTIYQALGMMKVIEARHLWIADVILGRYVSERV